MINQVEINLINANEQFVSNQKQKKFNEIHLNKLREKLNELNEQLNQPESISIEQISNTFISEISIRLNSTSKFYSFQFLFINIGIFIFPSNLQSSSTKNIASSNQIFSF